MKEQDTIRQFVRDNNLNQAAIARAYGCARPNMHSFLSGKRPIPDLARMLAAISAATGTVLYFETEIVIRSGVVQDYLVSLKTRPIQDPDDPEEQ